MECTIKGCNRPANPKFILYCYKHWDKLPPFLQSKILDNPLDEYIDQANAFLDHAKAFNRTYPKKTAKS